MMVIETGSQYSKLRIVFSGQIVLSMKLTSFLLVSGHFYLLIPSHHNLEWIIFDDVFQTDKILYRLL